MTMLSQEAAAEENDLLRKCSLHLYLHVSSEMVLSSAPMMMEHRFTVSASGQSEVNSFLTC